MNELDLNFNLDIDFEDIDFDIFKENRYNILKQKRTKIKNVKYKYAKEFAEEIIIDKNSRYYTFIDGSLAITPMPEHGASNKHLSNFLKMLGTFLPS